MNKLCCVIMQLSLFKSFKALMGKRNCWWDVHSGKSKKNWLWEWAAINNSGGMEGDDDVVVVGLGERGSEWAFASCSRPSGQWRPTWLIAPLSTRIPTEMLGSNNLHCKWVFSKFILWQWCAMMRMIKWWTVWLLIFHSLSLEKQWKWQMLLLAGKARVRLLVPDTGGR